MHRSAFATTLAVLLVTVLLSRLSVANGMFNDMYGKLFQVDLLDDCSVYVHDRVILVADKKGWCKIKKSSMTAEFYHTKDGFSVIQVNAYYEDDDHIVKQEAKRTNGDSYNVSICAQRNFDSVPRAETEYGRYFDMNANNQREVTRSMVFQACKYGFTIGNGMSQYASFDISSQVIMTKEMPACNSSVVMDYTMFSNETFDIHVEGVPDPPDERYCYVKNRKAVTDAYIRIIKPSIQLGVLPYSLVKNFSATFPVPYSKPINNYKPEFIGPKVTSNGISLGNGKKYKRPPIKASVYTEQPFFIYNENTKKYSPFFLYFKHGEADRNFTIQYIGGDNYQNFFEPINYMEECEFPTGKKDVTSAVPKFVKQDEKSIFFEVLFFINNVDFQYCVISINVNYKSGETEVEIRQGSDINAYVHVEKRSTAAVSCANANGSVRWLLAFSTKNDDAELISLDNSVSSPIFNCPHCSEKSKMYCDINPDAKKYHSAMFIQTVKGGKTHVTYVRVIKGPGYKLNVEHHTSSLDDEYNFVQNVDLKLELDEIFVLLNGEPPTKPTTPEPEVVTTLATSTPKPNEDYVYDSNWLNIANCFSSSWLIILCVVFFWNI